MRLLFPLLTLVLIAAAPPTARKPNALARESSPYLLQHAYNPVQWLPWGPDAFARAKKENKLVFLSIGYSSCHWCHVMEKESFRDPGVAQILNEQFICIKVDREERPDVDQVYMAALNALGNRGGWPLSMFLDAQGQPIIGGTYWPRDDVEEDGEVRPGFKTILTRMARLHRDEPKVIADQAEKLAKATQANLTGKARGLVLVDLNRDLIDATVEGLREEFDPTHGGFGNPARRFAGTKFPKPSTLRFLLGEIRRSKNDEAKKMLVRTLDALAQGGIYDQLGGGFHRYSVERTWSVPHFEKMLYDNAQLLEIYAEAYTLTKNPEYARILRETAAFVARELTAPAGGFYSALDADSEDEEGRFYVWTPKEWAEALPNRDDRLLLSRIYGTDQGINFEGKYHILRLPVSLEEAATKAKQTRAELDARLNPLKQQLFELRSKRPRPFLDTKILTAWNGQMIAGLARAGAALDDKDLIARATKAASFLLTHLRTQDGRLLRSWAAAPGEKPQARILGYLDDYAYLTHGLLALHAVTDDKRWLDEAHSLTKAMLDLFADDKGGFYYTARDQDKLFARGKDSYDGAQPAGNSVAASNLVRLGIISGESTYLKEAGRTLRTLAGTMKNDPSSLCWAADALAEYLAHSAKK
jgi:uncharacterized protein YyaL (SSP411 family)